MKLETVFAEVFSIAVETVDDDMCLQDLTCWDSMMHMILISKLEEEFDVQLTADEIADLRTVADARKFLKVYGAKV